MQTYALFGSFQFPIVSTVQVGEHSVLILEWRVVDLGGASFDDLFERTCNFEMRLNHWSTKSFTIDGTVLPFACMATLHELERLNMMCEGVKVSLKVADTIAKTVAKTVA